MEHYKPWLKMWVDYLDDLKMIPLSLAEQGAWWKLCALAHKCVAEGALLKNNNEPMSIDEIIDILRVREKERGSFNSMIDYMLKHQGLHWDGNVLVVTNYITRQTLTPSNTNEAIRERVRKHREKKKGFPLTTPSKEVRTKNKDTNSTEYKSTEVPSLRNGDVTALHVTKNSLPRVKQRVKRDIYGEFQNVQLSLDEYEKLLKRFGEIDAQNLIEQLSSGIASHGYKYKSHYATIINWSKRDGKKGGHHGGHEQEESGTGGKWGDFKVEKYSV